MVGVPFFTVVFCVRVQLREGESPEKRASRKTVAVEGNLAEAMRLLRIAEARFVEGMRACEWGCRQWIKRGLQDKHMKVTCKRRIIPCRNNCGIALRAEQWDMISERHYARTLIDVGQMWATLDAACPALAPSFLQVIVPHAFVAAVCAQWSVLGALCLALWAVEEATPRRTSLSTRCVARWCDAMQTLLWLAPHPNCTTVPVSLFSFLSFSLEFHPYGLSIFLPLPQLLKCVKRLAKPIKCPNKCGLKFVGSYDRVRDIEFEVAEHVREHCANRMVNCDFDGCFDSMRAEERRAHRARHLRGMAVIDCSPPCASFVLGARFNSTGAAFLGVC